MGLNFLFTFLKSILGKVLMILVGLWLFELLFSDLYLDLSLLAEYAFGRSLSMVLNYDAAVFLRDFLIFAITAQFFRMFFFDKDEV